MINKELSLIISFNKTTDAMAFEDYCLKNGIKGRLIPLPKEISSGCGLAFKSDINQEEEMKKNLSILGIECNNILKLEI